MSCANGVPITGHHGRSRNLSFGQHSPHSVPGSATCRRQPATGRREQHAGRPAERLAGEGLELFAPIRHVVAHQAEHSAPREHSLHASTRSQGTHDLQPIFDDRLVLQHKRRALAAAAPRRVVPARPRGRRPRRAARDRRAALRQAAALFCLTPAARDAILASGKAKPAIRVEPTRRFSAASRASSAASTISRSSPKASTSPSRCCRCRRRTTFPAR